MVKARIAIFNGHDQAIALEEHAIPDLKDGELLVKILCTTLCRSDLKTYSGKRREKTPTILGHEIVGTIAQFGPQSPAEDLHGRKLAKNDKISWAIYASDPNGKLSLKGIPQKDKSLFKYGHEQIEQANNFHGGLAEYIILRKNTPLLKINNDVPDSLAATMNCAVATSLGAIRLAGLIKNKNVLISGAGMLGIVAVAAVKNLGASTIVASDPIVARRNMATRFGVDEAVHPDTLAHISYKDYFDVMLEFSGNLLAMSRGIANLSIGGTAVWVGATFPQGSLAIDPEIMIRKLLTIKGLHNYNRADFINAVSFIEKFHDQYPFLDLIEKSFDLWDINRAFTHAIAHNPYRVAVFP